MFFAKVVDGALSFYNDEVHSAIPTGAAQITDAQWQDAVANDGKYSIINGVFTEATVWPPPATPAAIQKNLTMAVQNHMDSTAKARGYDNLVSVITYADEPIIPKFQAEGVAFRAWRSLVWDYCYQVLVDAEAGRRGIPTEAELIAELPTLILA